MSKYHANKGVKRNKKPLQNIVYFFEEVMHGGILKYNNYWQYEKTFNKYGRYIWSGLLIDSEIKEIISQKQFQKFKQGRRKFVVQRRINGKNI